MNARCRLSVENYWIEPRLWKASACTLSSAIYGEDDYCYDVDNKGFFQVLSSLLLKAQRGDSGHVVIENRHTSSPVRNLTLRAILMIDFVEHTNWLVRADQKLVALVVLSDEKLGIMVKIQRSSD